VVGEGKVGSTGTSVGSGGGIISAVGSGVASDVGSGVVSNVGGISVGRGDGVSLGASVGKTSVGMRTSVGVSGDGRGSGVVSWAISRFMLSRLSIRMMKAERFQVRIRVVSLNLKSLIDGLSP
jgi:hypothetical protein